MSRVAAHHWHRAGQEVHPARIAQGDCDSEIFPSRRPGIETMEVAGPKFGDNDNCYYSSRYQASNRQITCGLRPEDVIQKVPSAKCLVLHLLRWRYLNPQDWRQWVKYQLALGGRLWPITPLWSSAEPESAFTGFSPRCSRLRVRWRLL
jgi:hypothetical protein